MVSTSLRAADFAVCCAAALDLTGCWTVPNANVQPAGETRLIEDGIAVESVKKPAIVESVNPQTRTLVVLSAVKSPSIAYQVGPGVSNLRKLRVGDTVELTVAEVLSVYVLRGGTPQPADGRLETVAVGAKVLSVDRSYRLLTVQYPGGEIETFKVDLDIKLGQMSAGDSVAIQRREATAVRVGKERWLGL